MISDNIPKTSSRMTQSVKEGVRRVEYRMYDERQRIDRERVRRRRQAYLTPRDDKESRRGRRVERGDLPSCQRGRMMRMGQEIVEGYAKVR